MADRYRYQVKVRGSRKSDDPFARDFAERVTRILHGVGAEPEVLKEVGLPRKGRAAGRPGYTVRWVVTEAGSFADTARMAQTVVELIGAWSTAVPGVVVDTSKAAVFLDHGDGLVCGGSECLICGEAA